MEDDKKEVFKQSGLRPSSLGSTQPKPFSFSKWIKPGIVNARGESSQRRVSWLSPGTSKSYAYGLKRQRSDKDIVRSVRKEELSAQDNDDVFRSADVEGTSSFVSKRRVTDLSKESGLRASSSQYKIKRLLSEEEKNEIRSIWCSGISEDHYNKAFLVNHFAQFGRVTKVSLLRIQKAACVTFTSHKEAARAKKKGQYVSGESAPLQIFLHKGNSPHSQKRKQSETEQQILPRGSAPTRSEGSVPESRPVKVSRKSAFTELDPEVAEELKSLGVPQGDQPEVKLLPRPGVPLIQAAKLKPVKSVKGTELDIEGLKMLLQQNAVTDEQRYRVLDARDKLLRLCEEKRTDLSKERKIGTCPDMCPEKERYMRQVQYQVHKYEIGEEGGSALNHAKAVKQYSRSSADQEEPLPHELRPAPVLTMTLDYLLYHIVNRGDLQGENVESWYTFLWDRMRAIQKDITQQQLCDLETVALVEKCARFHIHCAARLCEEPTNVMDQRINTQSLTKCLQTLKYLYNDLRNKSVVCPNEPEFRAYVLLLNLNSGNLHTEFQQLHPSVRGSSTISYVVDVWRAIALKNYVTFFTLLRQTSYLNACLLQRYFNQVRTEAFQAMVKAYGPSGKPEQVNVKSITELLAFEDDEETMEFGEHLSLRVNRELGVIILDKSHFQLPDRAFALSRAWNLIESKRTCSVGEIVSGGPLMSSPLEYYKPHTSFDVHGLLRENTVFAKDQIKALEDGMLKRQLVLENKSLGIPVVVPEEDDKVAIQLAKVQLEEAKRKAAIIHKVSYDLETELETEVVNQQCEAIATQVKEEHVNELVLIIHDQLTADTVRQMVKEIIEDVYREKLEEERRAKEREATITVLSTTAAHKLVQDTVLEMTKIVAAEVLNIAHRSAAEIQRLSALMTGYIINEVASAEIEDLLDEACKEIYEEDRKVYLAKLSEKYFSRWRDFVLRKRRYRNYTNAVPVWPSRRSLEAKVKRMTQSMGTTIDCNYDNAESILKFSDRVGNLVKIREKREKLHEAADQLTINVPELIRSAIQGKEKYCGVVSRGKIFWKLFVSLPELQDGNKMTSRVNKILGTGGEEKDVLVSSVVAHGNKTLNVAIRVKEGTCLPSHLKGTTTVLFVMQENDDIGLVKKRLYEVWDGLSPYIDWAFLILYFCNIQEYNESEVQKLLAKTMPANADVHVKIVPLRTDALNEELILSIHSGLCWSVLQPSNTPDLVLDNLQELLLTYLDDQVWKPLFEQLQFLRDEDVCVMVELYNAALDHLSGYLHEGDVVSLFPPEMYVQANGDTPFLPASFGSDKQQDVIKASVTSLRLQSPTKHFKRVSDLWKWISPILKSNSINHMLYVNLSKIVSSNGKSGLWFNVLREISYHLISNDLTGCGKIVQQRAQLYVACFREYFDGFTQSKVFSEIISRLPRMVVDVVQKPITVSDQCLDSESAVICVIDSVQSLQQASMSEQFEKLQRKIEEMKNTSVKRTETIDDILSERSLDQIMNSFFGV